MPWSRDALAAGYDRVAELYAERFDRELDHKPFDRQLLDDLAARLRGSGSVCDLGCGPGHIARYLCARGVDAFGLDLSPGMIEVARRLGPSLRFEVADMRALPLPEGSLAGVVAFYSLIHLQRAELPAVAAEVARVLQPGGMVLAAVHGGEGELHADEFLGQPVSFDASLFGPDELAGYFRDAGMQIEEVVTRPPYEIEYPSTRIYVRASRP